MSLFYCPRSCSRPAKTDLTEIPVAGEQGLQGKADNPFPFVVKVLLHHHFDGACLEGSLCPLFARDVFLFKRDYLGHM